MALSRRLKQIDHMVDKHYSQIWDCCCDHGHLGFELLDRSAADTIHFVDVVEPLMTQLQQQLQQHAPNSDQWQVHCLDVAQLPIATSPAEHSHLVIIAGVGGDLMIELVTAILASVRSSSYPSRRIEFLLCPVYHQYKLRCALIELDLKLQTEHLLRDNKQFYEIIHVAPQTDSNQNISPVGSLMWDLSQQEHRDYRQRMIQHYGNMAKRPLSEVGFDAGEVLAQYQALLPN